MLRAFAIAVLVLAGCREQGLAGLEERWRVEPASLRLPNAAAGGSSSARFLVHNDARGPLELALSADAPFSVPPALVVPGGATAEVEVLFQPATPGELSAVVAVRHASAVREVQVAATALDPAACGAARLCHVSELDVANGVCVERPVQNGVACESRCVRGGACVAGECLGTSASCDDRNACTADSCDPTSGCRHDDVSAACPAPANPCQRASCDALTGCGVTNVDDGTACGSNDCVTAHVCISGVCETRASPDGSRCGGGSLCQAPSVCSGQVCVPSPATFLPIAWRYDAPMRTLMFESAVDPEGNSYFTESSSTGVATQLVSLDRLGQERFRVLLQGMPCSWCGARVMLDPPGGRIFLGQWGRMQARSLTDGALLWAVDTTAGLTLRGPLPDGGGQFSSMVLVAQAPDTVVEVLLEGSEVHRQYAFALDRATGHESWRRDWWGHLYSPGVSAQGELWATHGDCWAPIGGTDRVDAFGHNAGSRGDNYRPVAFVGTPSPLPWPSRALLVARDMLWSSPAGDGTPFTPTVSMSYPQAVGDAEHMYVASGNQVADIDADGGTRWTQGLRGSVVAASLEADGGVLLSFYTSDGGSSLAYVDPTGALGFDCPLTGSAYEGVATHGLWIAQVGTSIIAYEVPGAATSAHGWSTFRGNPWNDHRPH